MNVYAMKSTRWTTSLRIARTRPRAKSLRATTQRRASHTRRVRWTRNRSSSAATSSACASNISWLRKKYAITGSSWASTPEPSPSASPSLLVKSVIAAVWRLWGLAPNRCGPQNASTGPGWQSICIPNSSFLKCSKKNSIRQTPVTSKIRCLQNSKAHLRSSKLSKEAKPKRAETEHPWL